MVYDCGAPEELGLADSSEDVVLCVCVCVYAYRRHDEWCTALSLMLASARLVSWCLGDLVTCGLSELVSTWEI